MRMLESGKLGWVEREVEPRQWADQVEECATLLLLVYRRCVKVPNTRIHLYDKCDPGVWYLDTQYTCHTPCGVMCWCMAGVCIQVKKVEQNRRRRDMARRREQTVRSIFSQVPDLTPKWVGKPDKVNFIPQFP